ncbi:AMP-binding enzyme family protein [Mycobacteroides abscessus 21]|uniref:AMP-binding enzyme family protein n=1 Tax=Mycobacteroides abscessus 21 TaxID=1299324 RepID=A0A829PYI5_9MYCO|nr:AMP-binding enzyme family protein [Mycobacteroides abscessus 21]
MLPYSSGTTGKAKGVMLTHHNLVANIAQAKHLYGVQRGDRVLAVLPFFHIYGLVVLLNVQLKLGAELVILPRFELDTFLGSIANYRVDHVFVAPPVAVVLAKHPDVDKYDVSCLRSVFSGAAPLDEQLGNAVAARLNCRVSQGYGMTELSPVSHLIPPDRPDIPLNSVGIPVPNSENKIIDTETGDEIEIPAEGESAPGELLVRGPNVMAGYLGNEEATAATIEPDGFLHTGDIAVVRADGVVTIVDRLKELIKYKGYQVPPAELEALLLTHPGIGDAAVIGVPDPSSGEIPKAFVVRTDDDLTDEAVMAFVEQKVAPHKRIRQVEFIDAIPKSAAGKILRKDLRARI